MMDKQYRFHGPYFGESNKQRTARWQGITIAAMAGYTFGCAVGVFVGWVLFAA